MPTFGKVCLPGADAEVMDVDNLWTTCGQSVDNPSQLGLVM